MAAPMEHVEMGSTENDCEACSIEATVATGFEEVARDEAKEKLGTSKRNGKGKIVIKLPVNRSKNVLNLCSVDNCRVLMCHKTDFGFNENELECMQKLREFVTEVDWDIGLKVWKEFYTFHHPISSAPKSTPVDVGEAEIVSRENRPQKKKRKKGPSTKFMSKKSNISNGGDDCEQNSSKTDKCEGDGDLDDCDDVKIDSIHNDEKTHQTEFEKAKELSVDGSSVENTNSGGSLGNGHSQNDVKVRRTTHDPTQPSFRVTCNRVGGNHCFDSMCAASNFGGAIYKYFGWNIDLTKFDIEVLLNILDQEVSVCIALTKDSLHRRNISSFGPTTLRPTIAYNMLRLCNIQPGEVVCDPMCGSGSIPIEAAMSWSQSMHICGEIHHRAVDRTVMNVENLKLKNISKNRQNIEVGTVQWNVCYLPLRENSVDVFVTDLPFGKRLGRKQDNWSLYAGALENMARVSTLNCGRVCLLTSDKRAITKAMQTFSMFWTKQRNLAVNIGGLSAVVYLLKRTGVPFTRIVKNEDEKHSEDEKSAE